MSGQGVTLTDATLETRPTGVIDRMNRKAMIFGAIGAAATVAGFFVERGTFLQSYLIGYMFWLYITLGCLGLLMIQHLSGGAWGIVSRRVFEAAVRTLPVMAILFIPIAMNLAALFPWARPEAIHDAQIQTKAGYLNAPFFLARYVGYFVIWIALGFTLAGWSAKQDIDAPVIPGPEDRKFRVLSGPGLVLMMITITFMSVDWMMSLDPHWSSTIFGVLFVGGAGLSALAFTIVILASLSEAKPMSELMVPDRFHDLGKLMYAFVLLWAYFSVSQLIIVWSGNLPEEIPLYLRRFQGSWGKVSWIVLFGHFVVPFCFLLSRRIKRNAKLAARVALFILAMRAVEIAWMIAPMVRHDANASGPNWVDFAAVLGLGLVWLLVFFRNLGARAVVPVHDPYLKGAYSNGGH
jgi:hypothetical protein